MPALLRRPFTGIAAGAVALLAGCASDAPPSDPSHEPVETTTRAAVVTQGTCTGSPAICSAWEDQLVPNFPPHVAIHMHILPTGEMLFWPGMEGLGHGSKHAQFAFTYDPRTGAFRQVDNNRTDIFCSGHAFLPDGTLLVAGGHLGDDEGSPDVNLFDPFKKRWSRGQPMAGGRWYPTVTPLASGEALVLAGRDQNGQYNALPQVYSAKSGGKWRSLTSAVRYQAYPYYPFIFPATNGRAFYAGPERQTAWLDPSGTGAWTDGPQSAFGTRDYGSAVMYAPGKIMIVGGGGDFAGGTPTNTAEIIDISAGGGTWQPTGSMNYARRQFNATILADGKVLATGGTSGAGHNNEEAAVRMAEIWDPATGEWRTLTEEMEPRTYHGLAILLPDGRVMSAGSGRCAGCDYNQANAQIFWPPYLFNGDGSLATRPAISSAPARVAYGASFTVGTATPNDIAKVALVRLGSVTHGFNENQLYVPLTFTAGGNGLTVRAPSTRDFATPGHYMLFILNGNGTPSEARIIQLQ